ncbi:UNVERIFIED_CONTAM: hypothetical protein Slati_0472500 [Sesamum latifolium]|uniref:Uncharacterized protein n=1 Tax=Sesamum latifolium TaxID=2727402 RepID=A0AAW2XY28_9LAMI
MEYLVVIQGDCCTHCLRANVESLTLFSILDYKFLGFSLRDRAQVEQLLHYIIDELPEDADSKRTFKFPFVACEIFTCEIDVILKTLVEEEDVVICLMLRKTIPLKNYVKVLVRLVGSDDHLYTNGAPSARRRGAQASKKTGRMGFASSNDAVVAVFNAREGGVTQGFRRQRRSGSPAAAAAGELRLCLHVVTLAWQNFKNLRMFTSTRFRRLAEHKITGKKVICAPFATALLLLEFEFHYNLVDETAKEGLVASLRTVY